MTDAMLSRALERCMYAIRHGESYEAALRRHQSLRPELDSLLLVALNLRPEPAGELPSPSRAALRAGLMDAIRREPNEPPPRRAFVFLPAWRKAFVPALAAATVAAVLLGMAVTRSPEPAASRSTTTVLTVLEGEVEVETSRGLLHATNGMTIDVGDRVLTGNGARAVLTFFDGSTVVLDPDSVVVVRQVRDTDGKLQASLSQEQGSTWTHIPQALGQADLEIQTPSARVETRQASVETTVRGDGSTNIGAQNGAVAVQSQGSNTTVPSGFNASVASPGAATMTSATVAPVRELLVRIEGKVYALVTDPRQATLGTVAPGVPVNQIPGAWSEKDGEALLLHIPNSPDGQYRISLSASGDSRVVVSVIVRDVTSDRVDTTLTLRAGEGATLSFGLSNDDVSLLATTKTMEPLPAAVVVPERAVEKATANTLSTAAAAASTGATTAATPVPTSPPPPTSTPRPPATATPLPSPTPVPPKPTPSISPIEKEVAPSTTSSSASNIAR